MLSLSYLIRWTIQDFCGISSSDYLKTTASLVQETEAEPNFTQGML